MSKEARQVPFTAYLEPTLWALAQTAVDRDKTTASSYMRKLILDDLRKKDILTPEIMMSLLDGTGLDKIIASQADAAAAEAEADALDELVSAKQT